MNYPEVLAYMYASLPMFHRVGAAALKPGLQNTIALCEAVGNPHRNLKTIHVAGTNGKGSSSHLIAAVLQSAGYKTGLYTSPHLKNFTERIKINGEEVSQAFVTTFVNNNRAVFETIQPSFFEMTVAMAFKYFEQEQVDIAVIEVGLGGRLDSTNIITPEACLITNISMDHQAILGDTLLKIASEKAGIIKPNIPVVISETQQELVSLFQQVALDHNAPILFADQQFQAVNMRIEEGEMLVEISNNGKVLLENITCELTGKYQLKNIIGATALCLQLRKQGWAITDDAIREGFKNVISLTHLQGRWQTLQHSPTVICDVAHNEAGIAELLAQLNTMKYDRLYWVFGVANDKDINKILKLLPTDCYYYFCQAKIPRAMDAHQLYAQAQQNNLKGEVILDVSEAMQYAVSKASSDSLILVGGSNFVVAEVV